MKLTPNIVNVRWNDGYLESFEATEVRFGSDLLWMRLTNGQNRHIPLRQVRWFSLSDESHAEIGPAKMDLDRDDCNLAIANEYTYVGTGELTDKLDPKKEIRERDKRISKQPRESQSPMEALHQNMKDFRMI